MTSMPRRRPSVLPSDTARTLPPPRCCCTSPLELLGLAVEIVIDLQRVIQGRHLFRREPRVEDAANDLCEFSCVHSNVPIPLTISSNSDVI